MNDDMRAAILVKESLNHYLFLGRHHTQRQLRCQKVISDLFRGAMTYSNLVNEPLNTGSADALVRTVPTFINPVRNLGPHSRNSLRKFFRTARRLTQPERNRRWLSMRIFDAHFAGSHALDGVRGITKLKDVAGKTLDRE